MDDGGDGDDGDGGAQAGVDLEARAAMLDRKEAKLAKKKEKLSKKVREEGQGVLFGGRGREELSPTRPATITNIHLN